MLGVRPDASTAEIRAAQRRLALELHPDRHGSTDPRRRAEVAGRMAEVNAAAAVLTDPARRAAYDRNRTSGAGPRAGSASGATGAAGAPHPSGPPPSAGVPTHPTVALAGMVPWLALAAVLVAIFVFTAYAGGGDGGSDTGDAPPDTLAIRDLRGQCVQESGGFTLIVDCAAAPHDGQIVVQGSLDATCPTGTRSWRVPQQDVLVCTDPATATR